MPTIRRVFTREQARSALQFVRRVAEDITRVQQQISDLYDRCRYLECPRELESVRERIQVLIERRDRWIREIEAIGCEYQDAHFGRVCFPLDESTGQEALCWMPGDADLGDCRAPGLQLTES